MATLEQNAQINLIMNNKETVKTIKTMTEEVERLKKALIEAKAQGNFDKVRTLNKEIKTTESAVRKLKKETKDLGSILKNINGSSIEELETAAKALRREIKTKLIPGTSEFIQKTKQLETIEKRIYSVSGALKKQTSNWKKIGETMTRAIYIAGTLYTAILGITRLLRFTSKEAAKFSDVYANIRKTTLLTNADIKNLNEEFKKLDTRTAREQLNSLAYEAGKLGIGLDKIKQGDYAGYKEEILGYVKASDILLTSMNDTLGNEASITIGKMANVYSETTKEIENCGIEEKMMKIGSVVNELGKSSSANEKYMVEFMARLGGIATQAGLSAADVAGFGSALDQAMMKVEMSATAFQRLIQQMIKTPAVFAKVIGKDVQEFNNMIKNDINGTLVQVLKAFQGQGGMQELQTIFADAEMSGIRVVSVISSLASNIDKVVEAQRIANQEIQLGTSCLMEYHYKNDSLQAQLDKAKKRLHDQAEILGQKLSPVLVKSYQATILLTKGLSNLSEYVKNNAGALTTLTILWSSYILILTKAKIQKAAINALHKIEGILILQNIKGTKDEVVTKLQRINAIKLAAIEERNIQIEKIKLENQITTQKRINTKVEIENIKKLMLLNRASQQDLLKKHLLELELNSSAMLMRKNKLLILDIERQKTNLLAEAKLAEANAEKAANAAMKFNPIGLILTALTILLPLIWRWVTATDNMTKSLKEFNKQSGEQEAKVRILYERLGSLEKGSKEYNETLQRYKEIAPEIVKGYINQQGEIVNLTRCYNDITNSIRQKVAMQIKEKQIEEILAKETEGREEIMTKSSKMLKSLPDEKKIEILAKIRQTLQSFENQSFEKSRQGIKDLFEEYNELGPYSELIHYGIEYTKLQINPLAKMMEDFLKSSEKYKAEIKEIGIVYGDIIASSQFNPFQGKLEQLTDYHNKLKQTNLTEKERLKITEQIATINNDLYNDIDYVEYKIKEITEQIGNTPLYGQDGYNEDIKYLRQTLDFWLAQRNKLNAKKIAQGDAYESDDARKDRIKTAQDDADLWFQQQMKQLKEQRNARLITEQKFNEREILLTIENNNRKLAIEGQQAKDLLALEIKNLDEREKLRKFYIDRDLANADKWAKEEKKILSKQRNDGVLSEKEYAHKIEELEIETLTQKINTKGLSAEQLLDFIQQKLDKEYAMLKYNIDKYVELVEKSASDNTALVNKNKVKSEPNSVVKAVEGTEEDWRKAKERVQKNIDEITKAINESFNCEEIEKLQELFDKLQTQMNDLDGSRLIAVFESIKKAAQSTVESIEKSFRKMYDYETFRSDQKTARLLSNAEREIAAIEEKYKKESDTITSSIQQLEKLQSEASKERQAQIQTDIDKLKEQATMVEMLKEQEIRAVNRSTDAIGKMLYAIFEDTNKSFKDRAKDIVAGIESIANSATQIMDNLVKVQNNKEEAELLKFKATKEQEQEALDQQLKAGVISQEEYNTKKEQLDAEVEEKEREMNSKQFERQKKADTTKAIIQGLMGIAMAWAQNGSTLWGIPIAAALSAIIAATTATQVAAIQSQPNPYEGGGSSNSVKQPTVSTPGFAVKQTYAEGGYTPKDTTDYKPVGYVDPNEWVAPAWMVRQNPIMFENLENIRKRHTYNTTAPMFANGGYTTTTTAAIVPNVGINEEMIKRFEQAVEQLGKTQIKAHVVRKDITKIDEQDERFRKRSALK